MRERKIHGLNAKEFRCILKYVLQSGGSAETFKDMEWSGVEKTCCEKQVLGNLPELCLYCLMDPRSDPGFVSCSAWWLISILLQLALPGVDQRTPFTKAKFTIKIN